MLISKNAFAGNCQPQIGTMQIAGPLNYEPAKEKPHFQLSELLYKSQSEMNRNLYFEIDTVLFILSYGNSRKSFMHYDEFNDTCLSPLMLSCLCFL